MMTTQRGRRLAIVAFLCAGACTAPPREAANTGAQWVGTITTEGDVTTVVNESGSVWGGDATLVQELSIGVEAGVDEYMFGGVAGVWATDERIYVLDSQIPVLRVYDTDGEHVMDIGREGQGPGEFTEPAGLAVTPDGDILVIESGLQIDVFSPDGESKATWNTGSSWQIGMPQMIVLGFEGELWVPQVARDPIRFGHAQLGEDRNAGEPFFPPDLGWESACLTYTRRGNADRYCAIPFQPFAANALMPDGSWAVGITNEYAFNIHSPDGSELRVRRYWEPVPVRAEEAAYRKQQTTQLVRERWGAGPDWTWTGPEIPTHKPAYEQLIPDRNGRLWVLRAQASQRTTDCIDDATECWATHGYWLDAFGRDGRYHGSVTLERYPSRLFIDGSLVLSLQMDETGTYVVERYRIVLPGGETPGAE